MADKETRLFVRFRLRNDLYCVERGVKLYSLTHSLSVVSVSGVHPMGERTAMLHKNLIGIKIRDQPINTRNLVSLLSGK